jgi:protoporphyrinogen/coproporphyrinogen III oxidase
MTRIAIIGGGISGLAAAFAIEELRKNVSALLEYVLYESSPRLGGVLRTEHIDGCIVEAGPDSFITEKPWATELCRVLGLGDQLIGSNDADRKTYILVRSRLGCPGRAQPAGLAHKCQNKEGPSIRIDSPSLSFLFA